jgi:hypothetical protein
MCIEDYEKLPIHETLRTKNYLSHEYNYSTTIVDFYQPIKKYLKEKIGECFDDIYSDLISKTRPRYRHLLERDLSCVFTIVNYYEKEVPHKIRFSRDSILYGEYYLDKNNKIRYFETKNELLIYAKNKYRQKKLERILDFND